MRPLLLSGGPAVGETTCARALAADQERAAYIDGDDVRQLVVACFIVHSAVTLDEARKRATTRPVSITDEEFELLHRISATPPPVDLVLDVTRMTVDDQIERIRDARVKAESDVRWSIAHRDGESEGQGESRRRLRCALPVDVGIFGRGMEDDSSAEPRNVSTRTPRTRSNPRSASRIRTRT
ncbi:hypothetical protein [Curtobacterium sp. MR_MD2014]|uniref:hypothetical protein n=1 Tax=Curtobacterium sp. MR_MD2014 TaxID=1561023 RepID=UPI0009DF1A1C|nr:hypothetical protein [Curtobacterium sp. MR_MD2014]